MPGGLPGGGMGGFGIDWRITKAALSPQLFKDPECWSGRDLNPRPPARWSNAEPTGRRLS